MSWKAAGKFLVLMIRGNFLDESIRSTDLVFTRRRLTL